MPITLSRRRQPKARPHQGNAYSTDEAFLFVLSANDQAALGRTKEQLVHFLGSDDAAATQTRNLVYTRAQRRSQLA